MTDRVFLSKADIGPLEEEYVLAALRSGWVAPLGPEVDAFESEVADRVGVAGALALSSGTAALHLALLELGVGPGSTVVLSSMTFAASANAVAYTGASPVFIDSHDSDGNVDVGLLLHALDTLRAEGTEVAAVMSVDLFGRCADYAAIVPELEARGVALLEDAAEALGAEQHGTRAGSFGRAAALSFNGNKIMTTSGGGMLLSDDLDLLGRARYLSTQARQPVSWYEHTEIGYNYRMSNILAALGRAQLARLDSMIARRREIRDRYAAALVDVDGVRLLGGSDDGHVDNCWLTCIVLDPAVASAPALIKSLDAADIEARHLWKPMHAQPVFSEARAFVTGVSDRLFANGVTLPSGSALSDDDVDRVVTELHHALGVR
jgi:dTDP-4-amino-4,6-dideoxygalactose transaminase